MKFRDSLITQLTLANGAALVAGVVNNILTSSEDVNSNVGGAPLSAEMIHQLAQSSFQIKLNNELKG
jgi:hypothetical protein